MAEDEDDTGSLLQHEDDGEVSDEELHEYIKENGGYESLLSDDTDSSQQQGITHNDNLETQIRTELKLMKEAVLETLNPFTFLACFVVMISMYLSLIGWGPYLGPVVGPWLHGKGLPGGSQWVDIHEQYGGHRTLYTSEGEKRNHEYMKQFAENVSMLLLLFLFFN
jgi:hypothetical protein